MDLTAIRKGLSTLCETEVPNSYEYRPAGGTVASFPALWVELPALTKIKFQQKVWRIELDVVLAVSDVWDRSAQKTVDQLLPPLWAALESEPTLGGEVAGSVNVTEFVPIKSTDNVAWVGGIFTVQIAHTDT